MIDDPNTGTPTDTLTIDLTNDGTGQQGTFTGGGLGTLTEVSPGHWTLVDLAANIQTDAAALLFNPAVGAANTAVTTTFALQDTSSAAPTTPSAIDGATTVTDTVRGPTITGTVSGQRTTNGAPIHPFSGVTLTDSFLGIDAMTIQLSNLGLTGTLTGSGISLGVAGAYVVLAASPGAITTALNAAVFTPASAPAGGVTPTTFTLTDISTGGPMATDSNTTLTNTNPTDTILFQNVDGQASIWQLNATNFIGGGAAGSNPGSDWTAIGLGDFFGGPGAAPADILWQNTSTGQASIWEMNGTNVEGGGGITDGLGGPSVNPGTDWKVVGTGQFDGAGSSDILLQNVDGQASIWDMTGNAITGGGQVSPNPGQGWTAVGTGDFNHDGTSDILWQNTSTGAVSIWNMGGTGGTTVESGGPVNSGGVPVSPGADWKAIGTGNFSGDGYADDIIFQNTTTSQVSIWNIGPGETLTGGGAVATPGTGWSAIGSDGGGSEILLQNTNGQTSIWDMSGTTIAGGGPTSAHPGPNWAAVGLAGHAIV